MADVARLDSVERLFFGAYSQSPKICFINFCVSGTLLSTYLHVRLFGLTLIAVTAAVYLFLSYAYISLFCFLAGLAAIHLIHYRLEQM